MPYSRRHFLKQTSLAAASLPLLRFGPLLNAATTPSPSEIDDLYASFRDPSGLAKPFVRWWWNGNRIAADELLRELDLLRAAGIGGIEINSVQFPPTADDLGLPAHDWLSDTWLDLLKIAVDGARERGLACDIIVGSGWPFGGEFLPPEEQTQLMALGTRNVTGPTQLRLSRQELINAVNPPVMSKRPGHLKELSHLRLAPAFMESFTAGSNLDDQLTEESFTIDVPAGEHVLYFLVKLTGFQSVILGAPGASGPVLNHFNQTAVQRFLDRMSTAIESRLGGRLGDHFRSLFVDSLELEGANWCDDMPTEFERRRGYALAPFLPYILFKTGRMGRALPESYGTSFAPDVEDQLARVRHDFEITKMDLFRERFLGTFLTWCREHGVQSRVQAYGREAHPSDTSMLVDLPEGETWIRDDVGHGLIEGEFGKGRAYTAVNKFVSSGAHLAGKHVVGCEETTNTRFAFHATLELLKITADQSALSGMTQCILHGFNYSPPQAPFPGWVRYGTFYNERNPWWPHLPAWITYKARLCTLFQRGTFVADIGLLHPHADHWSKYGAPWDPFPERAYPTYAHNVWEAVHQCGGSCDHLSETTVQSATIEDGRLIKGFGRYRVVILLEVDSLEPATAEALARFVAAGGRVVFVERPPSRAPGWHDHASRDRRVADAIATLGRDYPDRVLHFPAPRPHQTMLDWYRRLAATAALPAAARIDKPVTAVSQVHYRCGDRDVFFFANADVEAGHAITATFLVPGRTAWLWDAETGRRYLHPTDGDAHRLRLDFAPAESKVIVFEDAASGEPMPAIPPPDANGEPLTEPWRVTLAHVDGTRQVRELAKLIDFNADDSLRSFAGELIYKTTLTLPPFDDTPPLFLELGHVPGVSSLTFNGQLVGHRWHGRHRYEISSVARPGQNTVAITVATTLGNYLKSLPDNRVGAKWLKDQPYRPLGLLGPVRLLTLRPATNPDPTVQSS